MKRNGFVGKGQSGGSMNILRYARLGDRQKTQRSTGERNRKGKNIFTYVEYGLGCAPMDKRYSIVSMVLLWMAYCTGVQPTAQKKSEDEK